MKKQFLKRAGALFLATALVVGAVQVPASQTKAAAWEWKEDKSASGYEKVPYKELTVVADTEAGDDGEGANNGYAKNAIDGDTNSYWHSNYHGNNNPVTSGIRLIGNNTITITLANPQDIAGFTYLPRQGSAGNGIWVDFKVEVRAKDSKRYETAYEIKDGQKLVWNRNGSSWVNDEAQQEREFLFDKIFKNVEKVRFTINETDGANATKAFINAAEIGILKALNLVEVDKNILAAYAKSNSEQAGGVGETDGPASYAFNGEEGNWWHSYYSGDSEASINGNVGEAVEEGKSVWIQTGFGEKRMIAGLQYQSRKNGNNIIKDYDISIANLEDPSVKAPEENQWTVIKSGVFGATEEMQTVRLDGLVEATHIRLTAKTHQSTGANTDAHVTARHIKVLALEDMEATGIKVVSEPTKVIYKLGEEFDPAGMVVKKVYPTSGLEIAGAQALEGDLGADNLAGDVIISGYDKTKTGQQTITVSYGNLEAKFEVTVGLADEVDNKVLRKYAQANSYTESASGTGDGPAAYAFDGKTDSHWHSNWGAVSDTNISGVVSESNPIWIQTGFGESKQITKLTYRSRVNTVANIANKYEIKVANITDPEILGDPDYQLKDEDFEKDPVKEGTFEGTNEPQTIEFETPVVATHIRMIVESVTRGNSNGDYVTASEIQIFAKEIACIRVTPPMKTEYVIGEALDTQGIKVEAIYGDGTEETLGDDELSKVVYDGFDSTKAGVQTVTATYSPKEGKAYTSTFEVTVSKDATNGLIAYYTFDTQNEDGSFPNVTTEDTTIGNALNNGNNVVMNEDGVSGNSVIFDGATTAATNQYLTVENAYKAQSQASFSFWMNASESLTDVSYLGSTGGSIFHDYANASTGRPIVTYKADHGANQVGTFLTGTDHWHNEANEDAELVEPGKWYHVVAVSDYANQKMIFYVNGVKTGEAAMGANYTSETIAAVRIGAHRDGNKNYNGLLDNVRIYNKALNAEEVAAIYDVERPRVAPTEVTIDPSNLILTSLEDVQSITVKAAPENAEELVEFAWESSDESVIVDDVNDSTTTIMATKEGKHSAVITVTATSVSGVVLTGTCTVSVDVEPAVEVTITAEPDEASADMGTVTITTDGEEIVSGAGVPVDTEVVMTAAALEDYRFVEWRDDQNKLVTRDAELTITTDAENTDVQYYAHFKPVVTNISNVAAGKIVTGVGDLEPEAGYPFSRVTDGNYVEYTGFVRKNEDGSAASAAIQIDLGKKYENIDYIKMVRYYGGGRTYYGTAIAISDDAEVINPIVIYNSDSANNHNLGVGTEALYAETAEGHEFVVPEGTSGRYVTIYMQGNNAGNASNHIIEVEVYAPEVEDYDPNIQTQYWDKEKKEGNLGKQTEEDIWHYQAHHTDGDWEDIEETDFTDTGDENRGIWGSDGNSTNGTYGWGAIWRTKLTPCFVGQPYDAVAYAWKATEAGYVQISLAEKVSLHASEQKDDITVTFTKGTATVDTKDLFKTTIAAGSQDVDTSSYTAVTKVGEGDYLRIAALLADNDLLNVQPVITYVTVKEYAPEYLEEVEAMTWDDGTYTEASEQAFNDAKEALKNAVEEGAASEQELEELIAAMEAAVEGLTPVPEEEPAEGLIGYYEFEEQDENGNFINTAPESDNKLSAAVNNGVGKDEESVSGSGSAIFGSTPNSKENVQYLTVRSTDGSEFYAPNSSNATFSFWMKASAEMEKYSLSAGASIFHDVQNTDTGRPIVTYDAYNGEGATRHKVGTFLAGEAHFADGSTDETDGDTATEQWYHVAAVSTPGTEEMTFYINGVKTNTVDIITGTGSYHTHTGSAIQIGAHRGFTNNFNGLLDNVRIYNKALTEEEIAEIYTTEKPSWDVTAGYVAGSENGGTWTVTSDGGITSKVAHTSAVTFTAQAADGYQFAGWYSDEAGENKLTDEVSYGVNHVQKVIKVYAKFVKTATEGPVITAEPDENSKDMGTVAITVNGQEAASGSEIKAGDEIVMTAAPKDGYRFVEWRNAQGEVETRDAVLSVTIGEEAESAAYYAHFKAAVSGAVNVALNKTVTGVDGLEPESDPGDSSKYAFGRVTDGSLDGFTAFSKTKADGSGDSAAIQIDLGKKYENLDYIKMVRYYSDGRTYNGTAIVISDDPEMSQNAKVIYNSDHANLHNKGVGTEALYAETAQGHEFVIPEGVSGRYVTIYMCGNTQASGANPSNHIIEIEVYAPETQQSGGNTDELKKEVALAETLSEQIKDDPMYADDVKAALTQAIEAAQALLAQEEAGEEVTDEAIAAALAELEKAYQDAYLGQDAGDYNPNVQTEYWDAEKNANTLGDQTEGDVWHYQVQDTAGVWSDIPTESFTASGDSGNGIWGSDGATADATYSWGAIWRSKLVPCLGDGGYNAVAYGWKASKDGYVKISLAKALNLHTDSGKDNITFSYTKGTATADEQELFSETLTAGSQDIAVDSYTAITKVTAGDYLRIAAYFANNDLVNVEPVITYITAREYAQEYLEQVGGISLEDKTEESAAAFTAAKDALDKAVKDETSTSAKLGELIEALETAAAGLTQAESPKTLESITVTPPTKTTYKVGDTLDTAGMKVTANYSDGSTEDVTSAATLSGFDSASAGTKTVTVTYEGKTATFTVTIEEEGTTPPPAEKTLESIEVTPPTKTTYKVGEELDKTGLKVTAKYSDGSTEDVTDQAVLSGFDSAAEGEQTITVTYEGKTAEFTVTVEKEGSEKPPVEKPLLRSITVTPPAKTVYKAGEALDLTGMKVTAAYSDGTTADVTADAIVSGYDPNKAGTQTITVSYNGKTVTFTVTVEDGQTPVVTPPETQTPQGDGNGNSPAVATGDNTPIGLMMTMMLLAAGVIVMTRKKRAM